ncbi:hypothetical protein ACIQNG_05445 [Streptomyces sp. NPDC091377]|uniref:hypothetical protein n=1 Tax=unclassified Streptomyces TaxID=2593676 RepID=UPI0037F670EB
MAASAHLLLSALTDLPEQSERTLEPGFDAGFDPDPDPGHWDLCVFSSEGPCAQTPLTSEPPLPDAEPLTSEPPLAAADADTTRP